MARGRVCAESTRGRSRCHSESAEPRVWWRGRERWSAMRNPPSSSAAGMGSRGGSFAVLCPSRHPATPGAPPALDDSTKLARMRLCRGKPEGVPCAAAKAAGYSQGTTCSDRLRGRRFHGATRFPGQSPGLDCLARLRAPTIRPTNSRPMSGTLKFRPLGWKPTLLGETPGQQGCRRRKPFRFPHSL